MCKATVYLATGDGSLSHPVAEGKSKAYLVPPVGRGLPEGLGVYFAFFLLCAVITNFDCWRSNYEEWFLAEALYALYIFMIYHPLFSLGWWQDLSLKNREVRNL